MGSVLMFPTPLPGETIASIVTRYHRMAGCLGVRRTLLDLFGSVTKSYVSSLPCYLGHLEAVSGYYGLAHNHTLLPFFKPFLSLGKAARAEHLMQANRPVGLKMELGITAAGFERYQALRYCPRCIRVDFAVFGVSYWHVCHQAAGVHICPKHHCLLHRVMPDPERGDFNQFFLPSDVVAPDVPDPLGFVDGQYFVRLAQLADLIEWGISNSQSIATLMGRNYLHFLIDRAGFISNGRLCATEIEHHFREAAQFFPNRYEFQRLFELHQGRISWPLDLLRRRASSRHPLLFYTFLNCLDVCKRRLMEDSAAGAHYSISVARPALLSVSPLFASNLEVALRRESFTSSYPRCLAKDTSDYTWLYRHDKAWLHAYISSNKKKEVGHFRVDWLTRDNMLEEMVKSAATEIETMPGAPIKVSLAAICRQLSVPADTFRHKEKLLKTMAVIQQCVESQREYQIRKLAWASSELKAENKARTKSSLLRKSNIRVCYLSDRLLRRFLDLN